MGEETERQAAITYLEIVSAVLADAFDESRRADAKTWVQARHAWLWDAEEWTFKQTTGTVTFTTGAQTTVGPTDVAAVLAVYASDGTPLHGIRDLRQFFNRYNSLLGDTGTPEAYTMVDGQILVGPSGDGTTGLVVYEKTRPQLVADTDTTGLPSGYDLALVHGGKAEGFKLTNIPLAANFDADFTAFVNALRNNYLETVNETGQHSPAYRPGTW